MNILMVGASQAGAWQMRGLQLGGAIGARATTNPDTADWAWADVAILVKRAGRRWASAARARGVPIVWDAIDFWAQPAQNALASVAARCQLQHEIDAIRPVLTIGATAAMARDAGGTYLPHHGMMGLAPAPAREEIRSVGYSGNPLYLGRWRPAIEAACAARGWTFVENPPDLTSVDVLVALRDGVWDGWMCREWKSGVKVVNAILAGRPLITQDSAAVREIRPPDATVIETMAELPAALDAYRDPARRAAVVDASLGLAPAYGLERIAACYRRSLEQFNGAVSAKGVLSC